MDAIFKKLNYKGQARVLALNAPESFLSNIEAMRTEAETLTAADGRSIGFAIGFAVTKQQVGEIAQTVVPLLEDDAIFWICYPKGSSKKYKSDFNRDTGWEAMGACDMEPVRQVAIDEDWSALRFRKIENIKNFTRRQTMALSEKGKERAKKTPE